MSRRRIFFFFAILIGAALGVLIGWASVPANSNMPIESLRADYKTDYVLMVAEVYQTDHDISVATQRLAVFVDAQPEQTAYEALLYAQKSNFSAADINLLDALTKAFQTISPTP